jgi:N-acetyl sugar amidotransferase
MSLIKNQINENIRYCQKCVMPFTKPDLEFYDNQICSACYFFDKRTKIDWEKRKERVKEIFKQNKNPSVSYDCIIPCSGGKDSTYQTLKILDLGYKPLCVNASTDKLSEIGRYNIENLKKLGVDFVEISTNPIIRRKINKFTLETVGDISWAEHLTIFTIPVRIAVQFKIPLIIWGENPQNENGGPLYKEDNHILDRSWLEEFGGLLGLRTSDIIELLGVHKDDLYLYTYPTSDEIKKNKTTGIFLGHFFPWDGEDNANIAFKNGFKFYHKNVEGSIVNYENLDNVQMRIHDYFKFLKYGYDRVTDWCCWKIRRNRLTRDEAKKIVLKYGGKYPNEYLGFKLSEILEEINCSLEEFNSICDKFTNKKLFQCNNEDELIKDENNNLILKNLNFE